MTLSEGFLFGRQDASLHEVIAAVDQKADKVAWALITVVDGDPDVANLLKASPLLRSLGAGAKSQRGGVGVLVSAEVLTEASRTERLFFEFDEVWLFPRRPTALTRPPSLLGPDEPTASQRKAVRDWMVKTGCTLGLAESVGLDYCARVSGVERLLLVGGGAVAA